MCGYVCVYGDREAGRRRGGLCASWCGMFVLSQGATVHCRLSLVCLKIQLTHSHTHTQTHIQTQTCNRTRRQKIKRNECICHDLETETIEKSFSYRVAAAAAAAAGRGRLGQRQRVGVVGNEVGTKPKPMDRPVLNTAQQAKGRGRECQWEKERERKM